jgi:glycosyltransferase involved in cell wall biosynthesis
MSPKSGLRRRLASFRDRVARALFGVGRKDVSELRAELTELGDDHGQRLDRMAGSHELAGEEVRRLAEELRTLRRDATEHLRQLTEALHRAEVRLDTAGHALAHAEIHTRIVSTMSWIAHDEVSDDPLVSVILPTRDRADLLRRAIGSVLAQSYPRWELVVVDDGSEDDTPRFLASLTERRVRSLRTEGVGVGAARNRGLEAAAGEIIVYLDDDNVMHPEWLRSVVWGFARSPHAEVVFGARVVDAPVLAGLPTEGLSTPILFERYDRARLEQGNYIDLGVIAHRAGLAEARFDERLTTHGDWDLLLRLTQRSPPVALPVIASFYTTSAPGRLTDHPKGEEDRDRVLARVRQAKTLRILGYNSIFPLFSETYIEEELETLADHGAEIAYCRGEQAKFPMPVPRPVFEDLDVALRHFAPDLLFLHWTEWANHELARLREVGLPYAVRSHSFDFDPERAARILSEPGCIGLWAFPHHAESIPGAFPLPPILRSVVDMPDPAPVRDVVLSVSAGLPKKDWDLLVSALDALRGRERHLIVGVTNAFEDFPERLAARLAELDDPPHLQVNVPRGRVYALLARTAVLLYTLEPGLPFGNPMSVVEGLCAGASVVVPDRPEAVDFAGPHARGYRTSQDIVRHVNEILAGGPDIEAEQAENRRYGRERFCDPLAGKRFFAEVTEALERWRAAR